MLKAQMRPLPPIDELKQKFSTSQSSDSDGWKQCLVDTILKDVKVSTLTTVTRRFFISKKGYMGIGPESICNGDIICVLLGCRVPVLLRSYQDRYIFVGECFVWGIMDGEAMTGMSEEGKYSTFRLV
jgi:hypothetical protein